MQQISAPELARMLHDRTPEALALLDVREPWEFEIARLPNSINLPMQKIPGALAQLDPAQPVVCICHHGMRSLQVAMFLANQGFGQVMNLSGGIDAWSRQVDPTCATY